ncbi:hypothetical protein ISS07_06200 [Candidatus Woesearchaeota archaeon]|nr:hypothetical protein [Candidatus Woesearchaeota archaeon]
MNKLGIASNNGNRPLNWIAKALESRRVKTQANKKKIIEDKQKVGAYGELLMEILGGASGVQLTTTGPKYSRKHAKIHYPINTDE